jgi:predicted kinase
MKLKTNTLYILSGIPGCGKSTFIKNNIKKGIINKDMVVSSDKIRKNILGKVYDLTDGKLFKDYSSEADGKVFEIMENMIEEKTKEHLVCFVDATNTSEQERNRWNKIAKKHNMKSEVLIFEESLETCIERNLKRKRSLSLDVLEKFNNRLERKSLLPYRLITSNEIIEFEPLNVLNESKIDVIGDVHGLYSDLILLLNKLGYDKDLNHKEGRKLLFVGDLIDRGPDSIEVLELVFKAVQKGHYCIQGNHEIKLLNNWVHYNKGESPYGSPAVIKTFVDFLTKIPEKEQQKYIDFLSKLPTYYIVNTEKESFVCVHANVIHFDPVITLRTDLLYGSCRVYNKEKEDTDKAYQTLFEKGKNKYTLIRGHLKLKSKQNNVFSVEEEQCFNGYLTGIQLDKIAIKGKDRFEEARVRVKTTFNYKTYQKETNLSKTVKELIENKLVVFKEDDSKLLKIYKYSKSVFFKNLWDKNEVLLKTRGLVLDLNGDIVQHPFTKVFNYGENSTGLNYSDKKEVIAVEKLNGFLGCISKHPYKNELLITTTGSFDSDFVGYIKDFIDPKLKGEMLRYLSKNNLTLMFEVIHPNDPHIIKYEESEQGLYLIGARGKKEFDNELAEESLDLIAEELSFKRAKWFKILFGELKELVKNTKLEGYMVRDINTDKILLKFKSPYYLTTKFIGRMSDNNIKFMYSAPNKFKEKVDEEFYPIVDEIVEMITLEEFLSLTNEDKISRVRDLINNSRL